jgi:hypothetical protein
MTKREQEHYEIARRFGVGRVFSRPEFIDRYHQEFPDRPLGSMIPSDYCVNLHAKGAEGYPRFMRQIERGRYELIDAPQPA